MDEANDEKIRWLLAGVGMIIENASSNAFSLTAKDTAFVKRIDALARAVEPTSILLRAAAVAYAEGRRVDAGYAGSCNLKS